MKLNTKCFNVKKISINAAFGSLGLLFATVGITEEVNFHSKSRIFDNLHTIAVSVKEMCYHNYNNLSLSNTECDSYGQRDMSLFLSDGNSATWISNALTSDAIIEARSKAYLVGYMSYYDARQFYPTAIAQTYRPISDVRGPFGAGMEELLGNAGVGLSPQKPALAQVVVTAVNPPRNQDLQKKCGRSQTFYLSSQQGNRSQLPTKFVDDFSTGMVFFETMSTCSTIVDIRDVTYYSDHDPDSEYDFVDFELFGLSVSFGPDKTPYAQIDVFSYQ